MTNKRAERLKLEPEATEGNAHHGDHPAWRAPLESEIEHSKAISLKRIADALDAISNGAAINVNNSY